MRLPRPAGSVAVAAFGAATSLSAAEVLPNQEQGHELPADAVAVFQVLDAILVLMPGDVAEASPQFGSGGPGLSFRLAAEAGGMFSDLTGRAIGERMSLSVCGDILVAAEIREKLDGAGYVALDSLGSAVFYAARMTGEKPCD